jgi:PAS domain S-box-containing protein
MLAKTKDKDLHSEIDAGNMIEKAMVNAQGLIVVLRGRDGICVAVNPRSARTWATNDVINRPMRDAFSQLGEDLFNKVELCYDTALPVTLYELLVSYNNSEEHIARERYFDIYFSPYFDNSGQISGVVLNGFDVTDRVEARGRAAEQQLLFKDITDAAGTALWTVDVRGYITFVNHTWIEWTGHPYNDHLGRGWIEYVVPADRERVISSFIRDLNQKAAFQVDFRVVRADGRTQWVAATGKPRYLSTGEFAGYVGSCMDITDRKMAERAMQDSERRFRHIADSAPVLIWMTGPDKRTTFLNKNWTKFADVPQLLGDNGYLQSDLVHPQDKDQLLINYIDAFESRQEFYFEYRMQRSSGEYRWIGMKGVPRYNAEHVFEGYIGSGMDITEMKEHEQVKNDFIGMASHELKTPITSIKAYVQLLLTIYGRREHDEFLMRSLTTVNKQINKLTRLITDLLDVSKMESGRLSLNSEEFVLNDLLKETIDEVQHTATQHDIIYQQCPQISINADRDRIAQVITNFLTNAIKYSPESDRVDVEVTIEGDDVVILIRDYGIGINPEEQNKIFNRFYRVEGRNEQTFSGFGIGLFVAAEIIKRHNGRVWVESEKDRGAAFYFTLPLSEVK